MQHIVAWAAELSLGGFSKPGFPGIIICEGQAEDVEDYTARLRSLKWSAMAVRADETGARLHRCWDCSLNGMMLVPHAGGVESRAAPGGVHD